MGAEIRKNLIAAFSKVGVLRSRDFASLGIPRAACAELLSEGILYRSGRGLYGLTAQEVSEHRSLAEVSTRVPNGVVCLLSALAFHEITTQNPSSVWIAVDRKARYPSVDYPPIEVVRFSGPGLVDGVKLHAIEGVAVKITSIARTVVDCFKYRNKLGLDIALEALIDAWSQKRLNLDEVAHFAALARMENVMKPYLATLR
ncbi:MAG: transcriptional regulator [Verrucomicrobia bacterium]|nr:transcriptional regulator [Verrucomicrobiota bacterium]